MSLSKEVTNLRERLQYISLGILSFVAVVSELISYYIPSYISRVVLLTVFFMLLSLMLLGSWQDHFEKGSFSRKATMFAVLFVISFSFLMRRYFSISPTYVEKVAHSQTFLRVQSYSEAGALVFDLPNSYFFQHSLVLHFLSSVCGVPIQWTVYISLSIHAILVALIGVLILRIVKTACKNCKNAASFLIPALVAFSLVSFAYSQRIALGLLVMFLLMCYLFDRGLGDETRGVTILLFVLGITFGSSTSVLVMIPFFFLFSIFRRRSTAILYGLIPLSYLTSAGYSYTVVIEKHFAFAWEGFSDFFKGIVSGEFPERVLPWQRQNIPTAADMYVTSVAYISLLLLCAVVVFIAMFIWAKERHSYERNDETSLFRATSITLLFTLGIASLVYVGASVNPETTFSDIRTIVIIFMTLLLPFLFVSSKMLRRISVNKVLLTLLVALMIAASLRTFYETYPKSIYDPINAVEDVRVDPLSVYRVGDFLRTYRDEWNISFDYKMRFLAFDLSQGRLFTSEFEPSDMVVFDMNGLKLGSLYTSPQAYAEAYNFTLTQNVIYDNGNITITKVK